MLNHTSTARSKVRRGLGAGASVAAVAASILAMGAVSPAFAQDKDNDSTVGEVVVTAQFREQNLQQTPIAITAVNAAMMDERSYTRITDLTAQAPNVQLQQNPAGFGNSMRAFIRGVGQSDFNPAVDPGVGMYVDDVYYASLTGSIFDLLDLDRVEILRGPQGTLSGMNSLGGSVKLYSRKPNGEGGFVEATAGSLQRMDVRASGDFTLAPDKLFVRLSGVARSHSGFVDRIDYGCSHPNDPDVIAGRLPITSSGPDCKLGEMGDQHYVALRGSLRWLPTPDIEVNIIADGTRDRSHTTASTLIANTGLPPYFFQPSSYQNGAPYDNRFVSYGPGRGDTVFNDPYINYGTFLNPGTTYRPTDPAGTPGQANGASYTDPSAALDSWGVSGTVDWKLADKLSLKSISGYRHFTSHGGVDNDGSPVVVQSEQSVLTHRQASEELRLNGTTFGDHLDYTVGGIYMDATTTYAARVQLPWIPQGTPTQPTFDFEQSDPVNVKTWAAFFHSTYHLTDKLNLSTGVRYTKEEKVYTFHRYNIDGVTPYLPLSNPADPAHALNGYEGTFKGSHVDYRANLDYQVTDDILTYAQFSTGFKGGGVNPRPYYLSQVAPFNPETLNAYEVGIKSQWFDRRVRLNLAAFYNQYHNYQGLITSGCVDASGNPIVGPEASPCGQTINVADAKVKGGEAELEVHPIPGMTIDAAYSYLDFKFGAPFHPTTSVTPGQGAPGIGKVKWSGGVQYEFPLAIGGTLTPRLDVAHTPGYCGNLACDALVSNSSYNLVNARVTYRSADGDWSVAVEATNLTDKLYYLSKFTAGAGYYDGQPGQPREWAVTVRRNF